MRLRAAHVRVRVPATSANLGPGFDALGLALGLHDELEVRALGTSDVRVEVEGEGAGTVPDDETHLVVRALRVALDHVGAPQTGLHLTCRNRVPHGRGLGSSAAAVVAGILAARGLVAEPDALDDDTALALATELEGHPDNAAPAILGGLTVAWSDEPGAAGPGAVRAVRLAVHEDVAPVAVVPPGHLSTRAARGVLPAQVPHADAAWQAGRSALLVEALGRNPELLFAATGDRLHQGYRREVMPASLALVDALRSRGVAAVVSGAGPTVLALARRGRDGTTDADAAIADAFGGVMAGWRVLPLDVDTAGASVTAVLD
ncbi:homoserine kinase [Cellulomonas flavigena DSM 20109]|uniref:Homoserine kinase n=1 Tax=Cellulomonas flavigena (strain ATCC 482 / DSM 20109 / BCRC 11376 / JCM 18109 / NBRC 3775 / NCIMB 8073 / NRS 134) TaxID=446466 RepID=D5ULC0_CELFN|nr:homoserine kinase [Cellulomonas flavigena]ADG73962.1 homoserine kinase [Cellulomonas flavigena DSM 20109]